MALSEPTSIHQHGDGMGRRIGLVALAALFAAIALKWAWAKTAVALFALPDASFSQTASVVIAIVAVLLLVRLLAPGATLSRRRDPGRESSAP